MKITRFKLLQGGNEGIAIEAEEYLKADGKWVIIDDVKRTRKLIIPDKLMKEIAKLKYFFLNLTNHWIHPYTKFYDSEALKLFEVGSQPTQTQLLLQNIWNKTSIIYATLDGKGFSIGGRIDSIESKPIVINCPAISADDDVGFFNECVDLLESIFAQIDEYFTSKVIPIEAGKANLPVEETEGKTITELTELVAENFQKKGAIILMDANTQQDSLSETTDKPKTVLHTGTGSIDGANIKHAKGEADDSKSEKKEEPYGKPASEAEFNADLSKDTPQAKESGKDDHGDLGPLEHTENVGDTPAASQSQDEEW